MYLDVYIYIYIYYVYIYIYMYIRMHMSGDFAISCGAVCFGLRLEGVQLSYRLPLYRHRKRRAPCGHRAGSRAHGLTGTGLTGFSRATGQHGLTGSRAHGHVTRKDHSRWQTGSNLFDLPKISNLIPFCCTCQFGFSGFQLSMPLPCHCLTRQSHTDHTATARSDS